MSKTPQPRRGRSASARHPSSPYPAICADGSDSRNVSQHHRYRDDGRPGGALGKGMKSQKLDYLLLSGRSR